MQPIVIQQLSDVGSTVSSVHQNSAHTLLTKARSWQLTFSLSLHVETHALVASCNVRWASAFKELH